MLAGRICPLTRSAKQNDVNFESAGGPDRTLRERSRAAQTQNGQPNRTDLHTARKQMPSVAHCSRPEWCGAHSAPVRGTVRIPVRGPEMRSQFGPSAAASAGVRARPTRGDLNFTRAAQTQTKQWAGRTVRSSLFARRASKIGRAISNFRPTDRLAGPFARRAARANRAKGSKISNFQRATRWHSFGSV